MKTANGGAWCGHNNFSGSDELKFSYQVLSKSGGWFFADNNFHYLCKVKKGCQLPEIALIGIPKT